MQLNNDKELKKLLKSHGFLNNNILDLRTVWISDLQLNRFRLEKAAQTQANKFEKWYSFSEDLSALIKERERIIREKEAHLDLKIRGYSESILEVRYGFTSLKEAAIKSIILTDSKLQKLRKNKRFLDLILGKLKGVLEAARQRKSMIKILTDLYVASYWDKLNYRPKQKE